MSIRTSLSLAVSVALVAAGLSYAQQASDVQAPRESAQQSGESADQQSSAQQGQAGQSGQERQARYRGQTGRAGQGQTLRLSEIMDLDVRNAQDEDLGDIEDVVVDVKSGKIRYAAVSVGGFLGVGDRLIAVPWEQIRIQQEPNDDDKYVLLNIDRARVENAPGFNEENWPDFGDQRYSQEVDVYYSRDAERRSTTGARTPADDRTRDTQDRPRTGTGTRSDIDVDTNTDAGTGTRGT